jgi:hypothetical protein
MNPDQLHPHIVPEEGDGSRSQVHAIGHGLAVELMFVLDGALMGFPRNPEVLTSMNLTPEEAYIRAIKNLGRLAQMGTIPMVIVPHGPSNMPYFVSAGHWASADAVLLPGLVQQLSKPLGTDALCASIPHRDALFVFPYGTRASRDAMRGVVQENEGSRGSKPLTRALFHLRNTRIEALQEE